MQASTVTLLVLSVLAGMQSASGQLSLGQACSSTLGSCGTGLLCLAGICVTSSQGSCDGISVFCSGGLVCVGGTCVAYTAGNGDPILRGFDQREFEFLGTPEKTYSVYADRMHQLNMKLFEGVMFDHVGTYIDAVGFKYNGEVEHTVGVELIPDGNLTVTVDGFAIHVGTISTVGSQNLGTEAKLMMVEWSSYKPNYGRAVEIQTGTLHTLVWAVPPGQKDEGGVPQPAYLNFRNALLSAPPGDDAQGLVGETLTKMTPPNAVSAGISKKKVDREFHGQGAEEDYEVKDLFDHDFKFSLYGKGMPTAARHRRMMESLYSWVNFPLESSVSSTVV